MSTKKPKPNWVEIEREVRESEASLRDIAQKHGVSDTAIRKRMKAGGWSRKEATPKRAAVRHPIAVTYLPPSSQPGAAPSANREVDDDANPAQLVARGRGLAARLLEELDTVTSRLGELEVMIDEATKGDDSDRRYNAMMKAISLPMRATTLRSLAQAIETMSKGAAPDGKKAQREEAAKAVGGSGGKYAVKQAPRLVVDNK